MNKGENLKVPTGGQVTDVEEIEMVDKVMESKHYAGGKYTEQFEHEFAQYVGKRYGIFVNSGSSANFVAVKALIETQGTYWFTTPAVAFPTTINPLIDTQRDITLVDVDKETYLPDNANYGAMTLGNYHPYPLIEDSCDAMFPGKYTGIAQTFSFFPAHHMTTGEGGMITTDDADFYRAARSYRDWGRDCWCTPGNDNTCGKRFETLLDGGFYDHKYVYSRIGYNLKATDIQAAIGIAQLKKLPGFTEARIRNFNILYEKLKGFEAFFILPKSVLPDTPWFGFPLTLKNDWHFSRIEMMRFLNEKGVGTRVLFGGNISKQPAYKDVKFNIEGSLVNSTKIMRDTFWVGCWHGLTVEQVEYAAETIKDFIFRKMM